MRRPLDFMRSLADLGDVVRVQLGMVNAYVVTHPELVHQMLVTDAREYSRGLAHSRSRTHFGNGLVFSDGEIHRLRRRMIQPEFRHASLARHTSVMKSAVADVTATWRHGKPLEMTDEMAALALETVTRSLFTDLTEDSARAIQRSVPILMRGGIQRVVAPLWTARLPLPVNRRFRRALSDVGVVVDNVISASRSGRDNCGDLLSTLLHARGEDGRTLSDQEIQDEIVAFYMAGVETSSSALAWLFYEIGRNPGMEDRLHSELDSVLDGRTPEYGDLPRLEYLGRIVSEVLREYSIWFQMRRTRRPVRLGSVRLPAGAQMIYSPYLLHHDPRWFPEPDRFDPDRWLPERVQDIPRHAFMPFGAGSHTCIGGNFAVVEYMTDLAVICSQWRLRPAPGHAVHKEIHATVHPGRLVMIPERRHR